MPEYRQKRIISSPIENVYNLILDLEKYPEFLPWCSKIKIIEQNANEIISEMAVNFKGITQKYTSKTVYTPLFKDKKVTIEVTMISGPFKHLNSSWLLYKNSDNATLVNFYINFAFKSKMLEKLIGLVFSKACKKVLTAFETRIQNEE